MENKYRGLFQPYDSVIVINQIRSLRKLIGSPQVEVKVLHMELHEVLTNTIFLDSSIMVI